MEIRPATHDDIDDVARLLSIIRMKSIDAREIRDIFSQTIDSPHADILIAAEGDNVLGMSVVNSVLKLNRIECRLDEVVVDENARGKGVGSALVEACNQWAWGHGCYKIEFTSRAERASAQEFYRKMGYEKRDSFIYTKISPTTDYVKTKVI